MAPHTRRACGWARRARPSAAAADPFADQPDHGLSASLLKSALQKNVRRCRADAAVKCAWALLRLEAMASRNCCDACRYCGGGCAAAAAVVAILVWLMAAHAKGFTLGRAHVDEVMRFARAIAATRARDDSPQDDGGGRRRASARRRRVATGGGDMVRAMLLRAAFGGMEGDIAMLHRAAYVAAPLGARRGGVGRRPGGRVWRRGGGGGRRDERRGAADGDRHPARRRRLHCSSVLESVLEQPAVRDALLARGGGDIDGLAQRAWKCSSGCRARRRSVRATTWATGWLPARWPRPRRRATTTAAAARRARWRRRGYSARAVRRVCAEARRWEAAPRRGPGGGAARAAAATAAPRAATDGRVDGAAADRALLAAVGSAGASSAQKCCRGRGRRRRPELRGCFIVEDFVSAEEEEALLEFLDGPACGVAWEFRNFNGPSRGKRWA